MTIMPNGRKTFECFGLVIHGYDQQAVFQLIEQETSQRSLFIVTANPEILLEAKQNPQYWNVLRQADLRLVDGFGLQLAGLTSGASVDRFSGVALSDALVAEAARRNWRVAMIGGESGNADRAVWKLRERHPSLNIMAEQGGRVGRDGTDDETGEEARFRLSQFAPDVLLVAFGHPKQESWIVRYSQDFPSVKILVGVGGTVDYWSGQKHRAPQIFQSLGLEWLWRLCVEPKRWKRIVSAVVVFPALVIWERISKFFR